MLVGVRIDVADERNLIGPGETVPLNNLSTIDVEACVASLRGIR